MESHLWWFLFQLLWSSEFAVLGVYTRTPNSVGVSWSVEGFSGSRERHSCKMNKFDSIFWSFRFERRFEAGYTWAPTLPKDLESRCRSNQPTSIELSLSYPLAFPPLTVKMKCLQCLQCLLQRWAIALLILKWILKLLFMKLHTCQLGRPIKRVAGRRKGP